MIISQTVKEYLSYCPDSRTNYILISDLNKIIYVVSDKIEYFNNISLSEDVKKYIDIWKNNKKGELFVIEKNEIINIAVNDEFNYLSQIILPIYHKGKIDGLYIQFTDNRQYVWTNLRNARTLRHFAEIMTADDFVKK